MNSFQIKTTGFGLVTFIADNLLLGIYDLVNEVVFNGGNGIGNALSSRVNDIWYAKPALFKKLVDWCVSQNVTSEFY